MLVYNADLVNVAYVGYRPDLSTTNASPVQPLGYTVMDGTRQLYGICPGGSAVLNVTPGGISQSASPAQIAAQINALGLMKDTTGQGIHSDTSTHLPTIDTNTNNVHTDLALGTNPLLNGTQPGALIGTAGNTVAKEIGLTGLNASVPIKLTSIGPFAAGAAWGPSAAINFTLGAAYRLVITPSVAGDVFATDLIVTHQDAAGNTTYTEAFTVTNWGNTGLSGGTSATGGVIVRGNLQGSKIVLSGTTISQANWNTINSSVGTVSGINITIYYDAYPIAEAKPKVTPWVNTGFVAQTFALSIANGGNFKYGVLPGYSGRAFMTMRTTVSNATFFATLSSFSVANGTSALYTITTPNVTASTGPVTPFQFGFDQLMHFLRIDNIGTATGTVDLSIIMADYV